MRKKLRSYQIEAKEQIYEAWKSHKNVLLVLPTGGGKCLGRNTPVLMFDGSIKMVQDVKTGELLMGPDSSPRRVMSTCKGRSEMFKITPIKGDSWTCNDVHILTLKETGTSKTIDIPLDDYLTRSKTFKHLHKQFRVGVEFPSKSVPFDPYLLGLYLADGAHLHARISNPESEIFDYLTNWSEQNSHSIRVDQKENHKEIHFSHSSRKWGSNKIIQLKNHCCKQDARWIPKEYLYNDRETRLQVLAGLLDGDGHMDHSSFQITTKYSTLRDDILYLCRSLGFAAYSKTVTKKIKSIGFEGTYFSIGINGDCSQIPNIVARKKAPKRQQIKDVLNTGFSVESIGEGDYYGFTLDEDGRFLLGDFTVTHNTVAFCSIAIDMGILRDNPLPTAILVHRKELVQQISLTLSEEEIRHNIIAPKNTIKEIISAQRRVVGKQFYDYMAPITVISVDTLNARIDKHKKWAKQIRLWITDEAAHLLKGNKWGKAIEHFDNAIGLGVTATPQRLDKRGLGDHADGVFHTMIEGPNTRWMIEQGYLSKYKIAVPQSDYQNYLGQVKGNSDYSKEAMAIASEKSHIVGDVVTQYKRHALNKQAILFATDSISAQKMEKKFIAEGIPAKLLLGTSSNKERLEGMLDFRSKKIKVLINIDLFDEGLDVPGIEAVIMARPTMSLGKYLQMIGRGLRPVYAPNHDLSTKEGRLQAQLKGEKPFAIIIDHVGNVSRHGLPCQVRSWTLDRIIKRQQKVNLIKICSNPECNAPYDRLLIECPWCGVESVKGNGGVGGSRTPPIQVDGDLFLIDPETLRELEKAAILEDPAHVAKRVGAVAGPTAAKAALKNQQSRIETQQLLSKEIAHWAGKMRDMGLTDRMIHKKFYLEFGGTITEKLSEVKADMLLTMEKLKW